MKTGFGAKFYIQFVRINQHETIPPSAFHSLDDGQHLQPLMQYDTVGQTPASFDPQRSFWYPKTIQLTS